MAKYEISIEISSVSTYVTVDTECDSEANEERAIEKAKSIVRSALSNLCASRGIEDISSRSFSLECDDIIYKEESTK